MSFKVFSRNDRMKTLVLVACLLVAVYANSERVKSFHDNIAKCTQELNKPANDPAIVHCVLYKEDLIDGEGMYKLEEGQARFDDLIADEAKRNQAKDIIRKCYDVGNEGPGTNEEKTLRSVQCAMPGVALIDKSE